jgi:hypothetical protein
MALLLHWAHRVSVHFGQYLKLPMSHYEDEHQASDLPMDELISISIGGSFKCTRLSTEAGVVIGGKLKITASIKA